MVSPLEPVSCHLKYICVMSFVQNSRNSTRMSQMFKRQQFNVLIQQQGTHMRRCCLLVSGRWGFFSHVQQASGRRLWWSWYEPSFVMVFSIEYYLFVCLVIRSLFGFIWYGKFRVKRVEKMHLVWFQPTPWNVIRSNKPELMRKNCQNKNEKRRNKETRERKKVRNKKIRYKKESEIKKRVR